MKSIKDTYNLYKESVKSPVSLKVYLKMAASYNKFLIKKVLDGEEVTLPSRLGTLSIKGRKQKIRFDENGKVQGLAPDWVKTKKLWDSNPELKAEKKLVYHTNAHTDSIRYKYFWSKNRILIENKTLYSLKLSRDNKRAVHSLIVNGKEYITTN